MQGGVIRFADLKRFAAGIIEKFKVKASGVEALGGSLSGGNMQKFIIGREVGHQPKVLLASHPTWGVDIGAALAIRQELIDLAAAGVGVLLVSEDLSELFEICDRICVLYHGHLSPPLPVAETSIDAVGLLMGGASAQPEHAHAA